MSWEWIFACNGIGLQRMLTGQEGEQFLFFLGKKKFRNRPRYDGHTCFRLEKNIQPCWGEQALRYEKNSSILHVWVRAWAWQAHHSFLLNQSHISRGRILCSPEYCWAWGPDVAHWPSVYTWVLCLHSNGVSLCSCTSMPSACTQLGRKNGSCKRVHVSILFLAEGMKNACEVK